MNKTCAMIYGISFLFAMVTTALISVAIIL